MDKSYRPEIFQGVLVHRGMCKGQGNLAKMMTISNLASYPAQRAAKNRSRWSLQRKYEDEATIRVND